MMAPCALDPPQQVCPKPPAQSITAVSSGSLKACVLNALLPGGVGPCASSLQGSTALASLWGKSGPHLPLIFLKLNRRLFPVTGTQYLRRREGGSSLGGRLVAAALGQHQESAGLQFWFRGSRGADSACLFQVQEAAHLPRAAAFSFCLLSPPIATASSVSPLESFSSFKDLFVPLGNPRSSCLQVLNTNHTHRILVVK